MQPKKPINTRSANGKPKQLGAVGRVENKLSENRANLLKRIRLFRSLTDKELFDLSSKVMLREFKKNHVILHEEDTNSFMYIIVKGKVKIFQITKEGKEMILSVHSSGDFFGEMSLIDGKTDPATVTALE